jgi:hypothetical protein
MSSVEHLDVPISEQLNPGAATDTIDHQGNAACGFALLEVRFSGECSSSHISVARPCTCFRPSAANSTTSLTALHRAS